MDTLFKMSCTYGTDRALKFSQLDAMNSKINDGHEILVITAIVSLDFD